MSDQFGKNSNIHNLNSTTYIIYPFIFRNVIIKDEPVSCPFCLGQCRTQICCKAEEDEEGKLLSANIVVVLACVSFSLLLALLLLAGLICYFKSWKEFKKSGGRCLKRFSCCKAKGNKSRGGQRVGRVAGGVGRGGDGEIGRSQMFDFLFKRNRSNAQEGKRGNLGRAGRVGPVRNV